MQAKKNPLNDMKKENDLQRFVEAQETTYARALAEIRSGRKQSHWMWFVFPQMRGLGYSSMAQHYGIQSKEEAAAYLRHPVLGKRLQEISSVLLLLPSSDAHQIFGSPDDLKLRSCMTLFASVPNAPVVFEDVLQKFFGGKKDEATLRLL